MILKILLCLALDLVFKLEVLSLIVEFLRSVFKNNSSPELNVARQKSQ